MTSQTLVPKSNSDAEYGFWLYLMSDAVLFGLIFASFVVMSPSLSGGPGGSHLFNLTNLTLQTGMLLTSTLTIALSHSAAGQNARRPAVFWLSVTLLLGAGFLAFELSELSGFIAQGAGPNRSGYLSAFFTLVGTHGLHVAAGIVWAGTLIIHLALKGPTAQVLSRLARLTLFWHFLDIVWIGVFSVVYLPELI